jgi:hypothetical protein
MKTITLAVASFALIALSCTPWLTHAADDPSLLRLSTCQDSWLEWKNDEPRMTRFAAVFESQFTRDDQNASFVPKSSMTLLGYPVVQVFPQSVGMGLGFSVVVNAPYAQVRQGFEKQLGKPMKCAVSEGTNACELSLGDKKTAMLMASDKPDAKATLVGCYYYYEK